MTDALAPDRDYGGLLPGAPVPRSAGRRAGWPGTALPGWARAAGAGAGQRLSRLAGVVRGVPHAGTYAGVGLVTVGLVLIAVAWGESAGKTAVALQIPYLISAGGTGLGLVVVGVTTVSLTTKGAESAERRRQLSELTAVLASLRAGAVLGQAAPVPGTATAEPRGAEPATAEPVGAEPVRAEPVGAGAGPRAAAPAAPLPDAAPTVPLTALRAPGSPAGRTTRGSRSAAAPGDPSGQRASTRGTRA